MPSVFCGYTLRIAEEIKTMCSPKVFLLVVVLFTLVCCESRLSTEESSQLTRRAGRIVYPPARRNLSVVDKYFGIKVPDPYRWLEDDNSTETKTFAKAQNVISQQFFDSCPVKDKIRATLKKMVNYERFNCPMKIGGYYFYYHNSGQQDFDVLYILNSLQSEPSVFLDPNLLSNDSSVSLTFAQAFTTDGSLFAYGLSKGGSDWFTIKVKRVPSGEDLPDTLQCVIKSDIAWTPDNMGFYYSRMPLSRCDSDPNILVNHTLYYHRLGQNQNEDTPVFRASQQALVNAIKSDDDCYLIISVSNITTSALSMYIGNLQIGSNAPVEVIKDSASPYAYITNVGTTFYMLTFNDAPFGKLIKIDINNMHPDNWVTVIPENRQRGPILDIKRANGKLILLYIVEAKSELYIHHLDTGAALHKVELELGSISCLEGHETDTNVFFGFESFVYRGRVYRLDMTTYQKTVFRESALEGYDPERFETRQVFYDSEDGTRVPMFIVHNKNLTESKRTNKHPVLLYGYGGFGKTITPAFDVGISVFLQHFGGVFATANIRGGGVYGTEWHTDGILENKQNSFDDFHAAARYLFRNGYAHRRRLAITGQSNGGLLVAACLNQKPKLFAAGVADVGLMDMVRYEEFTDFMKTEYGSAKNCPQFFWLHRYSPLHNIPERPAGGQYPATLLLTTENDQRVRPLHSLKFIAELQHTFGNRPRQKKPLLLHMDTIGGHEGGTTSKKIEDMVKTYSFLYKTLRLKWADA